MRSEEIVGLTVKSEEELRILQILLTAGKPLTIGEIMKDYESRFNERVERSENRNTRVAVLRRTLNNKQNKRTLGLVQKEFVIRIANPKTHQDSYKITEKGIQALTISEILGYTQGMVQKIFADDETAQAFFALTQKLRFTPTYLLDVGIRQATLHLKHLSDYDFDADIKQIAELHAYLETSHPDICKLEKAGRLTYKVANEIGGKDFVNILKRKFPKYGPSWLMDLPGGPLQKNNSKISQDYGTDITKNMTMVRNILKIKAKEQSND
jgi:hypothetical protein